MQFDTGLGCHSVESLRISRLAGGTNSIVDKVQYTHNVQT